MRACPWIFVCLLLVPAFMRAQITISSTAQVVAKSAVIVTSGTVNNLSPNTNLSDPNVKLILAATTGTPSLSSTRPLTIGNLELNSAVRYSLSGNGDITVTNTFTFTKGTLVTSSSPRILYSGQDDLAGSADSYINGTLFVSGVSGVRTFPIGDAKGYAPAVLQQVADADKNTELGFGVVSAGPTFNLGSGVLDYFKDRFWQFTASNSGSYSGSQVWLSSNDTETFFSDGKSATVLENDATGTTNDLGASTTSGFFASNKSGSPSARFYAIGKTDEITLKVHKLITPDGDTKNDVLFVEGIDSVPENEVTILDRWGVQFYKKKNFVNYPDASLPQQEGVDYSKLAIGNYVVVVQYNERGATKSVKQMITVLK
jgi:hypothetical protein